MSELARHPGQRYLGDGILVNGKYFTPNRFKENQQCQKMPITKPPSIMRTRQNPIEPQPSTTARATTTPQDNTPPKPRNTPIWLRNNPKRRTSSRKNPSAPLPNIPLLYETARGLGGLYLLKNKPKRSQLRPLILLHAPARFAAKPASINHTASWERAPRHQQREAA